MKKRENKYKEKEAKIRKDFELVEKLSVLMDEQYQVPGTKFRFGLDPIINFIPVLGRFIGFFISFSLVVIMAKNGVSPKVVIKMLLNVLLDFIISSIPFFGKIGDFLFKANTKNIKLLQSHYFEGKHNGSGIGIIITILIVFFFIFFLVLFLLYKLLTWGYEVIISLF